jgi:hypothetical protein
MVCIGIRAFLLVLRLPAGALGRLFLLSLAIWSLLAD